jgi:hypothetical protein
MIKKIIFPLFIIALLAGCGNEKAQENALLDSVKNAHDKIMGEDYAMMRTRARINKLMIKKPALKDSASYYLKRMDDNDSLMSRWMNSFNPDFTGKTHEQIITYLRGQKKEVAHIDSIMYQGHRDAVHFYFRNAR